MIGVVADNPRGRFPRYLDDLICQAPCLFKALLPRALQERNPNVAFCDIEIAKQAVRTLVTGWLIDPKLWPK